MEDALAAFDRAALILHAADTEMALVRSHMQSGDYRRALVFGAHTAGAHLDVLGGAALYAWLLHLGGRGEIAQRLVGQALGRSGAVWLRNGLGQLSRARPRQRLPALGQALLQLDTTLPVADTVWMAPADAYPGSVGYAVEYVAAPDATPAWPLLRTGFIGPVQGDKRLLGIGMPPGPRGGPVFDAGGRLAGLASPGRPGQADQLVTASQLRKALGDARLPPPPAGAQTHGSIDSIYETSLRVSLQLITPR
ncbi:MAG: hypothetical protein ABIR56_11215 [Polaromonas sp.]